MIPKVIHYCWFGRKPLSNLAKKCIESWKKFCPDYEIVEWNESNFDFSECEYARQAYDAKKWAFVSDYARFKILYENGGVYFDTDVELIKPIDDILLNGEFMGVEDKKELTVNPGLGLAMAKNSQFCKDIIDRYMQKQFVCGDNSYNTETIVTYTTELLKEYGMYIKNEIQTVCGITIYPQEYFNPCDIHSRKIVITEQTRSIHHYAGSWLSKKDKFKRFIRRLVGNKIYLFLYEMKHKK